MYNYERFLRNRPGPTDTFIDKIHFICFFSIVFSEYIAGSLIGFAGKKKKIKRLLRSNIPATKRAAYCVQVFGFGEIRSVFNK